MLPPEDLVNRFSFHPASTEEKQNAHEAVRSQCLDLANKINEWTPDGREKSLALTHLEEVMFWANASLARSK